MMTEQYFQLREGSIDKLASPYVTDDGKPLTTLQVLDLLNQQHEVIGICEDRILELRNEKKELERQNNRFKDDLNSILDSNDNYSLKGEWNNDLSIHDIRDGNDDYLTPVMIVDRLNNLSKFNRKLLEDNRCLKSRVDELEIENKSQSDAIDSLQGMLCHLDLEEVF